MNANSPAQSPGMQNGQNHLLLERPTFSAHDLDVQQHQFGRR